jgi:hypothetical protein
LPDHDDDKESSDMESEEALGIDPRSDDKELKRHLLKKYKGCLGNLRKELCKKRKKGKLPKEARQKLLSWWELHYRWPYPSVRDQWKFCVALRPVCIYVWIRRMTWR